jgi:hypothetical protein
VLEIHMLRYEPPPGFTPPKLFANNNGAAPDNTRTAMTNPAAPEPKFWAIVMRYSVASCSLRTPVAEVPRRIGVDRTKFTPLREGHVACRGSSHLPVLFFRPQEILNALIGPNTESGRTEN